jgi:2-oxo-4-hydroxy-4-carboxy--5-ureidoimidazoline (OHCU) decarboxylase
VVGLAPLPSLEALNHLPDDEFAITVGPLFEQAPRFLARLAAARPFGSWDELFERSLQIALAMPEVDQLELIDGHARLGADPAAVRARSALSYREQGYDQPAAAGEDPQPAADEGLAAELTRLNEAYEDRFGFRFLVFVAGRSREELARVMRAALGAERGAEIRRALTDVVAIARDRGARLDAKAPAAAVERMHS